MPVINTDQKAVFIHVMRMKTKLEKLMNDIIWSTHGEDKSGRFLQYEPKNQEEADQLIGRIKNLFNDFDLGIQQVKNEDSTITLTIPSYIIKESLKPDSQIIWPEYISKSGIWINESQIVAKLTKKILEINEQLKQSLENCHGRDLFIVPSYPSELKADSYYLIRSKGNTDNFFYVNESKEIVTKDIGEYFLLYKILEIVSVKKMWPNGIQPLVYNSILFDRALIMRSWEDGYDAALADLQKAGITNEVQLNRVVSRTLQNLCGVNSDKKTELMVIFQNAHDDYDFPLVIHRRFMQNHKNDRNLFVLNKKFAQLLIDQNENNNYIFPISKLSVLHHWSSKVDFFSRSEIINFTKNAIKKMPNLETVVMRGCASASNSMGSLVFQPKSCRILSSKHSIETASVNENEFLFQQTAEKNQNNTAAIVTYLKFYDVEHNSVIKKLSDIPLNSGNKLSSNVESNLALAAKDNNLPILSLPSLNKMIVETRTSWLRNEPIAKENKLMLQATQTRSRTLVVENFPKDSLTDTLDQELQKKGININIKGYSGPYETYPKAGIMTTSNHDHHKLPKALVKLKR